MKLEELSPEARKVRIDTIKELISAIQEGKRKAGLVDVKYVVESGPTTDQIWEDLFKLELSILAGNYKPLDFEDSLTEKDLTSKFADALG